MSDHTDMTTAYIEDIDRHEGQPVTIQRLAAQPPLERQDPLPDRARRHRLHPGRDVEGRRRRRGLHGRADHVVRRPPSSSAAPCAPTPARPAATRSTSPSLQVVGASHRLSDHAQGARRRLPARPPPPVDPLGAAAGDPARPPRGDRRRPRLLQQPRLHPRRHADLHARGLRGHDDAVPGAVLRGHDGLPDAERPALQRGQRDGARPGLLLRADLPRREVQDAPPPDRVLDGRARGRLRRPRRRHGARRGPRGVGRRARARPPAARAEGARARHVEARGRAGAVPAHLLRRGGADPARTRGCRSSGAATSAGPTRPRCRSSSTAR